MSNVHIPLTGIRFGRLVALQRLPSVARPGGGTVVTYRCICDCGGETVSTASALRYGRKSSCGCLIKESRSRVTHGKSRREERSPAYRSWAAMKTRCTNAKAREFKHYGARGISFDPRWESFEAFLADMGERPEGMTLERIDVNRGYGPDNCKWATTEEQRNNTRRNVFLTHNGKTQTMKQWADELGVHRATIRSRLRRGLPLEHVLASIGVQA